MSEPGGALGIAASELDRILRDSAASLGLVVLCAEAVGEERIGEPEREGESRGKLIRDVILP